MFTSSGKYIQKDHSPDNASIINNGQQNLLIFTVDKMASAKPQLKSIWLLITFPEFSNLTLVPIYPINEENPLISDLDLAQAFSLTDQRTLDAKFSDLLHDLFHWDYYLITDQIGVKSAQSILSHSLEGNPSLSDQPNPVLLPNTGDETLLNLEDQVTFWEGICSDLSHFSNIEELETLFNQVSSYFLTNLRWGKFSNQWSYDQSNNKRISCEFPTLTLNSP